MRLYFIIPFRVPFNLPKYRLLNHNEEWIRIAEDLQEEFDKINKDEQPFSDVKVGNYGWGQYPDIIYEAGDPGWFFRDFFFLCIESHAADPDIYQMATESGFPESLGLSNACWSCWLIDKTIAMLVLEIDISDCSDFLRFAVKQKDDFNNFTHLWPQKVLSSGGPVRKSFSVLVPLLEQRFVARMAKIDPGFKSDQTLLLPPRKEENLHGLGNDKDCLLAPTGLQNLFIEKHPVYPQCYTDIWNHHAFSFTPDEWESMTDEDLGLLKELLSEQHIDKMNNKETMFGWGFTSRLLEEDKSLEDPDLWLNALCVMQWFYCCFEIADTKLPVYIAGSQSDMVGGKESKVLVSSSQIRNELNIIINDYNDLRTRAAFGAKTALEECHNNWRLKDLIANLSKKITFLEDLVKSSSDAINKKTETTIQHILFLITLVGITGLLASIHEYLVGEYQASFISPLSQFALRVGKSDVIIYSLVVIAAFAVIYIYLKKRRR